VIKDEVGLRVRVRDKIRLKIRYLGKIRVGNFYDTPISDGQRASVVSFVVIYAPNCYAFKWQSVDHLLG